MTAERGNADFAVLNPSGELQYCRLTDEPLIRAVGAHIDDVSTQGMGRLRAWFSDCFASHPPNRLADRVLSAVGYHLPTGRRGTVALSMEIDSDGPVRPLTAQVRETLDELPATNASATC